MNLSTDPQYTSAERIALATLSEDQVRYFDMVRNQATCCTLRMRAAQHLPDDALSAIDNSIARHELRQRGIIA